jgi:hypothetical protein
MAPEPAYACRPSDWRAPEGFCELVEDQLGRFESARPGPVVDGTPTTEVFYSPSWGTGIHIQSVALVSSTPTGFKVIWTHLVLEVSDIMPDRYPASANVHEWRYSSDARRITVTGTRTEGRILNMWEGGAEGERTSLPDEAWCYVTTARAFEPC